MEIKKMSKSGKKSIRLNSIKYGILLGLVLIIIRLIEIYLKNFITINIHYVFMLLQVAVYVFFIYCTIKFAKNTYSKEDFSFSKGVKTALLSGLFAGIMFSIYTVIEIIYIIPDTETITLLLNEMQNKGITEDILAMQVTITYRAYKTFMSFFQVFLTSMLVSFFISPFFKERKQTIENQ